MSRELPGGLRVPSESEIIDVLAKGSTAARPNCVVHPAEARIDVCGRDDIHQAAVVVRLACGCAFAYCRHAVVIIYGRNKISKGICPNHGMQLVELADWLQ